MYSYLRRYFFLVLLFLNVLPCIGIPNNERTVDICVYGATPSCIRETAGERSATTGVADKMSLAKYVILYEYKILG